MPDRIPTVPTGIRFRVLVTGSRTWDQAAIIYTELNTLRAKHGHRLTIVHGACPHGADAIADTWCTRHGVTVELYPADWTHGRAAGQKRNAAMVATGPDLCVAFIRDHSPGATGCANLAEQAGIRTVRRIYTEVRAGLLAAALAHASRGWHVFPLRPGTKTPAVPDDWEQRATTNPERIRAWWATRAFNVGLAVGPSRLFVVDLDTSKPAAVGGDATSATSVKAQANPVAAPATAAGIPATCAGRHGRDVFTMLCAHHGQPIPSDTLIVATPSGGWHLYYRHPGGPALRNTKGGTARALGEAIDTRGHGGYVVAPGSIIGSRPYTVVRDREPMLLPGWLADLLRNLDRAARTPAPARQVTVPLAVTDRRGAYLRAALRQEADHVRAASPGRRNAVLWGAAVALGQLVAGRELTAQTVTDVLEQAAVSAGLSPNEARPTIRSGLRRGTQRPRTVA